MWGGAGRKEGRRASSIRVRGMGREAKGRKTGPCVYINTLQSPPNIHPPLTDDELAELLLYESRQTERVGRATPAIGSSIHGPPAHRPRTVTTQPTNQPRTPPDRVDPPTYPPTITPGRRLTDSPTDSPRRAPPGPACRSRPGAPRSPGRGPPPSPRRRWAGPARGGTRRGGGAGRGLMMGVWWW